MVLADALDAGAVEQVAGIVALGVARHCRQAVDLPMCEEASVLTIKFRFFSKLKTSKEGKKVCEFLKDQTSFQGKECANCLHNFHSFSL